jgi:hypothetical protein
MSVLNRTESGQPSILLALARTLWAHAGDSIPKDELLSRIAPDALSDSDRRGRKTLSCWSELGLFSESRSGEVSFAKKLAEDQPPKTLAWLRVAACQIALRDGNNKPLWPQKTGHIVNGKEEEEEGTAADLTRGIAWLLSQPHAVRLAAFPAAESLAQDQFGDARVMLGNNTRWSTLRAWMAFLGFAVVGPPAPKTRENILVPDPSQAIGDVLSSVFSSSAELPASEFLKRLAEILPVMDGGRYRTQTEKQIKESHRQELHKNFLSPTLSLSLRRLDFMRRICLVKRSDAPEALLQFGGDGTQIFTHVSIGGGKI